jgi:hypothetical protein
MMPASARRALLAACMAGFGLAAGAEPVHAEKHADKHTTKHAKKHTAKQAQARKPAHAHAHAHATAHKPSAKAAHAKAHATSKKLAAKVAHPATHAAALAAMPVPIPVPSVGKTLPKLAPSNTDPNGDGFLNLYVELCVKRIGEIDAFREKLLREKVPRLQPDSAKVFLSGMAGDAWPVPYQGKMGNFVLVLPEQKNLCMLYARRTDTAAVEQGFSAMVAKPPEPMIAARGLETHSATAANGQTRTLSTSWAPPGSERRMQFVLTTTSSPDAQVQAFGSVAIVVGSETGPGPDKAGAGSSATRTPNGSPAPAPRPRAQP